MTPAKPSNEAEDRAAGDLLLEDQGGEIERDQGRDEGERDPCASGTRASPQKKRIAITTGDAAADQVDAQHGPRRPGRAGGEEDDAAEHRPRHRPPEQGVIGAEPDGEMLHHRVHARKERDAERRHGEGQCDRRGGGPAQDIGAAIDQAGRRRHAGWPPAIDMPGRRGSSTDAYPKEASVAEPCPWRSLLATAAVPRRRRAGRRRVMTSDPGRAGAAAPQCRDHICSGSAGIIAAASG